jgi:hypothetical protein
MTTPEVSHGRGGAGNINPDDTKYVDGEIVRVGPEGSHGDGPYSSGRGGAANIGDKEATPDAHRNDIMVVPPSAKKASLEDKDYHTGRGGAGNEHIAKKLTTTPVGLADKLKNKIMGVFKK